MSKPMPILKVIRAKCLDCCCGSPSEVAACTVEKCPLHPYRMGTNPFRAVRTMTDEEKAEARERLRLARLAKIP